MHHVAILKASWKLIPEIIDCNKTIETRWYMQKRLPWNRIKKGDHIFFKDAGKPVQVEAAVTKVTQIEVTADFQAEALIDQIWQKDVVFSKLIPELQKYIAGKKYGIIVEFENATEIPAFDIDKTGYGLQAAWLSVEDIGQIRI